MNLKANPDPRSYFQDDAVNLYVEKDATGVLMETKDASYAFKGDIKLERRRKMPPQLNMNLSFPLILPPNLQQQTPQQLQNAIQQMLQAVIQQAGQQLQKMIQDEIAKQAPVEGIQHGWLGAEWEKVR